MVNEIIFHSMLLNTDTYEKKHNLNSEYLYSYAPIYCYLTHTAYRPTILCMFNLGHFDNGGHRPKMCNLHNERFMWPYRIPFVKNATIFIEVPGSFLSNFLDFPSFPENGNGAHTVTDTDVIFHLY